MTMSMADLLRFDPMEQLEADMKEVIEHAVFNSSRSLQKELGPSEVGHPCPRRIAFGLMGFPKVAARFDCLPSAVGTAAHDFFGKAFESANARTGEDRWLVEDRVNPFLDTEGNSDLFDTRTKTVVDDKFLSKEKVQHARKHGPRKVYRNQVQSYALGFVRKGYDVENVGIWFLPRGGLLADAFFWHEPFDPSIGEWVGTRLATIAALVYDLDLDNHPERAQMVPADTSDCSFCDWQTKFPVATPHCIPANEKAQ